MVTRSVGSTSLDSGSQKTLCSFLKKESLFACITPYLTFKYTQPCNSQSPFPHHGLASCFPWHDMASGMNSFPASSLLTWRASVTFCLLSVFPHFWCGLKSTLTAPSTSWRISDPSVFIHYWLCLPKGKLSAGSPNSERFNTWMQKLISDRCWSLGTTEGELRHSLGKLLVQTDGSCRCPGSMAWAARSAEKNVWCRDNSRNMTVFTHTPQPAGRGFWTRRAS